MKLRIALVCLIVGILWSGHCFAGGLYHSLAARNFFKYIQKFIHRRNAGIATDKVLSKRITIAPEAITEHGEISLKKDQLNGDPAHLIDQHDDWQAPKQRFYSNFTRYCCCCYIWYQRISASRYVKRHNLQHGVSE
ncbi:MAG: hypothetical protein OXE99_13730 [Cellvibrionales bacterium]|nr:hypothetical protein [Cellvibrionales bacterium]